ncbi:MAG TPA: CHC2 zinc finger domain-containing protein [Bryobacteraceae bacterium]
MKRQAEFLSIASRYTSLRQSRRQYVGLCPFHAERHPSFYIHPEKKIFYCFGCGAGGDVFDFIMRLERCDFLDALRIVHEFSGGVAGGSERVRSTRERFAAGEGAKPLGLRSKPLPIARTFRVESRADLLAKLDATNERLARIAACGSWPSLDCAVERAIEEERLRAAVSFTCQKPDNSP